MRTYKIHKGTAAQITHLNKDEPWVDIETTKELEFSGENYHPYSNYAEPDEVIFSKFDEDKMCYWHIKVKDTNVWVGESHDWEETED